MFRQTLLKALAVSLVAMLPAVGTAQQAAPLSRRAEAVRRKAESLAPQAKISVVRLHADEEFGRFLSGGPDEFTFYDVDRKSQVTLRYEDVKKIKDGYGGYNHLRHRHTDRRNGLIAMAAVAGLLGLLLALAATSSN